MSSTATFSASENPSKRTQQIPKRIPQFAILVGHAFQDFVADPVILGKVHRQRPQADDVRAVGFHDLERIDGVADRFGHFQALLVHREAVGQHRVIRRAPACAAALQQRALEPAAMLVAALQIQVGGPAKLWPFAGLQREDMGAAAVEPDVEDVENLFVIIGVIRVAQIFLRARRFPRIDAFDLDRGDNAGADGCVV